VRWFLVFLFFCGLGTSAHASDAPRRSVPIRLLCAGLRRRAMSSLSTRALASPWRPLGPDGRSVCFYATAENRPQGCERRRNAPFGSIAVHRGRCLIWHMPRTRKRHRYETSLRIRNVVVAGHRTSVRLEPLMWDSLQEIAMEQGMNVNQLVTQIKRSAGRSSLTSAIRVYIVDFYRSRAR